MAAYRWVYDCSHYLHYQSVLGTGCHPTDMHADMPIHIHTHTFDIVKNSRAQGLNLRRGRSPGGNRTVDINDEQRDGSLDEI